MQSGWFAGVGSLLIVAAACSSEPAANDPPAAPTGIRGDAGTLEPFDVPIDGLRSEDVSIFFKGDTLFDLALFEGDGLGPLYTRNNCGACHTEGVRGPGFVQKMSVVEADNVTPAVD